MKHEYTPVSSDDVTLPRSTNRIKYLFLFFFIFAGSFFILSLNEFNNYKPVFINHERLYNREIYTIDTEGCKIPILKPLDPSIRKFVHYPKVDPCPHSKYPLISKNRTHLWINKNNKTLTHYKIESPEYLVCCYKSFYRPTWIKNIESMYVDDRVSYNGCIEIIDVIEIQDEFISTECHYEGKLVYRQYFIFTHKKEVKLHQGSSTEDKVENKTSYNVLILGIDNVSRLNFYRTMPRTLRYLLKYGAIELVGYNKVGSNSFPNLVALLLGYDSEELKRICYPSLKSFFDECPFLWHWYKEKGYLTAFGEDSSYLGTFNYFAKGFVGTPTHYYIHPFIKEAEKNIGSVKPLNAELCMGEKYFYNVLLEYAEDLTETLNNSSLFAFLWEITMSHDYLNYPMVMDESYVKFFEGLEDRKYLDKSIVILMSDHGIRWGDIQTTKQGRLEEKLPFVYILIPPTFKNTYRDAFRNLKSNRRRLTTPFDIHETLIDLLDLENLKDETLSFRIKTSYAAKRGISLFLPVPTNRTCKTAGIADHWCTCHVGHKISLTELVVTEAAEQLVSKINDLMKEYPECAKLTQIEILNALEMVSVVSQEDGPNWKEYLVTVRTVPGDGIFEGTLRRSSDEGKWSLAGAASRLNLYGNQSWCVQDAKIKLYCFCM